MLVIERMPLALAELLHDTTGDPNLKLIAEAARLSVETGGLAGDLDRVAAHFRQMAIQQRDVHPHYFGVTMLNLGLISVLQDRPIEALVELDEAMSALDSTSASIETASLVVPRASVYAQVGRLSEAEQCSMGRCARQDLRTEADLVLEAAGVWRLVRRSRRARHAVE